MSSYKIFTRRNKKTTENFSVVFLLSVFKFPYVN